MIEAYASDWLQLLIRWIHLITGIAWIGSSFYFVFLDNSLLPPKDTRDDEKGVGGELWAVHGGGFYHVQKYRVAPATLPEPLHWFKWEAYWTWMSGFALLVVMYYLHADVYLIDRSIADLTVPQAIGISIAVLVLGWVFYDQLCKRLGFDHEKLLAGDHGRVRRARRVGLVAAVFRPRAIHRDWRDARHDHGCQRLLRHHPVTAQAG